MTKYKKNSIIVEAMQWTGNNNYELLDWITRDGDKEGFKIHRGYIAIETLEGKMKARKGDYIIKGIKGELYPCKPEIFEETYTEVGELTFNSKAILTVLGFMVGVAVVLIVWNVILRVQAMRQPPIVIEKPSPIEHNYLGEHTISFYNLNKNRTAQGTEVRDGHTIACDTSHIPANSYVYIEGWGVRQCVDTGLHIKGKRIDLYLNKPTDELLQLGIQKKKVYLLGEG